MTVPACLSRLAPSESQTVLLRACLWSGEPGLRAWGRWQSAAGDVRAAIEGDRDGVKSLLPLLHEGLRRHGGAPPPDALAAIRTAALAETIRWQRYEAICRRAFGALGEAGVAFLVLKGAALSLAAYARPELRHSHDIDVLVREEERGRAAAVLRGAGFAPMPSRAGTAAGTTALIDRSRLPLELHTRLYRLPHYQPPLAAVWESAVVWRLGEATLRTLAPEDHFVYVCGQAACSASRDTPKWAADACTLASSPSFAWERVLASTRAGGLELPLSILFSYLARELAIPVPAGVLDELARAAAGAERVAVEVALAGLRAGRRGRFRDLFRAAPAWRDRLAIARWMVLPSAAALRGGEPLRYPRAWPTAYLSRPLGYLARRLVAAARAATGRLLGQKGGANNLTA